MFSIFSKIIYTLFLVFVVCACGSSSSSPGESTDQVPEVGTPPTNQPISLSFVDVTAQAGLTQRHRDRAGLPMSEIRLIAAGLAAGDFDNDGFTDLYFVGGSGSPNAMLRNMGNGQFVDVAELLGIDFNGVMGAGATFADIDGDSDLDLFVGAVGGDSVHLLRNDGDRFINVLADSGLQLTTSQTLSASFGDVDGDGWLDLFLTHWGEAYNEGDTTEHLWRNLGDFRFLNASDTFNISQTILAVDERTGEFPDWTFSGTFADIDNDGDSDILVTGDFSNSRVLLNNVSVDGGFVNVTPPSITDENGMGSAVADYDNDGDLDWFVSSIAPGVGEPTSNITFPDRSGNRLYSNTLDDAIFDDVTDIAGVRLGFWGWGSCFADFNNDGHLDLFHVNGWTGQAFTSFISDPARLFIADGSGSFDEQSDQLGITDTQQGRGVVCFDMENDGDIDIAVANNSGLLKLYENTGGNGNNFLSVKLVGLAPNTQAVGARVYVTVNGMQQMREMRVGSNYVSHDPVIAHFGLGQANVVERLEVVWPGGERMVRENVDVNQNITLTQGVP